MKKKRIQFTLIIIITYTIKTITAAVAAAPQYDLWWSVTTIIIIIILQM